MQRFARIRDHGPVSPPQARGRAGSFGGMLTEGFVFDSVEVESGRQIVKADYLVNDTRMQIRLPEPLPEAHGGRLKIHIRYHYQTSRRLGRAHVVGNVRKTSQGAVVSAHGSHDDLRGWDTLPLHRQRILEEEFRLLPDCSIQHDRCGLGEPTNPRMY